MFYVMTAYMLYGFQLALTVIAVWVIVVKTKHSVLFHGQQVSPPIRESLAVVSVCYSLDKPLFEDSREEARTAEGFVFRRWAFPDPAALCGQLGSVPNIEGSC